MTGTPSGVIADEGRLAEAPPLLFEKLVWLGWLTNDDKRRPQTRVELFV